MRVPAVMLATLVALVGVAASASDESVGAAQASPAASAVQLTHAERHCQTVARQRLARLRKAALAKGRARVGAAPRARVRRKLRRCLRVARTRVEDPAAGPGSPSGGTGTPNTPGPTPPSLPSFVGVTASDTDGFRLTLSRPAVAAGVVTVELRNVDSGPHDLVIRPEAGGPNAAEFEEAGPGAVVRQQANLPQGRWYLYCSLPGHEVSGMHVTLRAE